jgi:transposase
MVILVGKEEAMKPIQITDLSEEQLNELAELYRTTHDVRLRTRAQMVLLAEEQSFTVAAIATIVRESEGTVRCWLKRYQAEGIDGLRSLVGGGAPPKVTKEYQELLLKVVRRRPRSLGQPYSMWTLQRLAGYMAEQTGIRVEDETVRVHLKEAEIVLSRPQHTISSPDPEYLLKKRRLKTPVMG